MICNTIGLTSDSFETLYVHGGAEVPEVYGSINYAQPIFYSLKTLTGATSYSFMGYSEPLKSYEIDGNMAQSGTPTPTSPIYPQECGDRTRNLLDYTTVENTQFNTVTLITNGISVSGRYFVRFRMVNFIIGQQYSMTWTTKAISGTVVPRWRLEYTDNTYSPFSLSGSRLVVEKKVLSLVMYINSSDTETGVAGFTDIMLNIGLTPLPYEPYGYKLPLNLNGATQNLYLTEPLRKIGDYADSISSDGTVTRRIRKLVLTGEESVTDIREFYNCGVSISSTAWSAVRSTTGGFIVSNNGRMLWATKSYFSEFETAADFKSYLAQQHANGTPVTVWYVLAEPTTEQVTTPTLTPATGNNTLAIGTTLQPSSVSITGHVKPSS